MVAERNSGVGTVRLHRAKYSIEAQPVKVRFLRGFVISQEAIFASKKAGSIKKVAIQERHDFAQVAAVHSNQ